MKIMFRPALALLVGIAVAIVATGCATTKSASQTRVCPQCKVATVTSTVPVFDGDGNVPPTDEQVTETSHSCPGCQSALAALFKTGKLQHKCSICQQEAFSCPSDHRWLAN